MNSDHAVWVVILAGGEGNRVRSMTFDRDGHPAPKQYSVMDGERSLLQSTLERAMRIAPPERIVPIVAAQHRRWWRAELGGIPPSNIVVQPVGRGTAPGILLPFVWIERQVESFTMVVLPSDHYVREEEILERALRRAIGALGPERQGVVLLGIHPRGPEDDCGWIVPCACPDDHPAPVSAFVEKPDPAAIGEMLSGGALLNSFIIVAGSHALRELFRTRLPRLWHAFERSLSHGPWTVGAITRLYESIEGHDFSKDLLERSADQLLVQAVPDCGWSDLGTPTRLMRYRSPNREASSRMPESCPADEQQSGTFSRRAVR